MADEVLAVLDATDTPACHFVGHALGGLAGLDLAVRRPDRLRSLTVVNGWAAAHAHTRRCFEMRLALLKHEGPAAYVRAQPIFLYPADWLAKNADARWRRKRRMAWPVSRAPTPCGGASPRCWPSTPRRISALCACRPC